MNSALDPRILALLINPKTQYLLDPLLGVTPRLNNPRARNDVMLSENQLRELEGYIDPPLMDSNSRFQVSPTSEMNGPYSAGSTRLPILDINPNDLAMSSILDMFNSPTEERNTSPITNSSLYDSSINPKLASLGEPNESIPFNIQIPGASNGSGSGSSSYQPVYSPEDWLSVLGQQPTFADSYKAASAMMQPTTPQDNTYSDYIKELFNSPQDEYERDKSLPLIMGGLAMAGAASNTDNFMEALTAGLSGGVQTWQSQLGEEKAAAKEARREKLDIAKLGIDIQGQELDREMRRQELVINTAAADIEAKLGYTDRQLAVMSEVEKANVNKYTFDAAIREGEKSKLGTVIGKNVTDKSATVYYDSGVIMTYGIINGKWEMTGMSDGTADPYKTTMTPKDWSKGYSDLIKAAIEANIPIERDEKGNIIDSPNLPSFETYVRDSGGYLVD